MSDDQATPPPSAPPPPPSDAPPPPPSDAPPPAADPPPPPAGPPPATTSAGGGSDNRTLMIVLAYLGPFALIPFLAEKDDQEVQWHAKHGLVLFGADILISIALTVVSTATACVGCFVTIPVWIAIAAVHIICIVKGVSGERFLIPGLSDFADKF